MSPPDPFDLRTDLPSPEATVCTVSNNEQISAYHGLGLANVLRRLEDRIRELCAKTITAQGTAELESVLTELKSALHEHSERLRTMAVLKLVRRNGDSFPNRRSA
jgi:hypothetical protein